MPLHGTAYPCELASATVGIGVGVGCEVLQIRRKRVVRGHNQRRVVRNAFRAGRKDSSALTRTILHGSIISPHVSSKPCFPKEPPRFMLPMRHKSRRAHNQTRRHNIISARPVVQLRAFAKQHFRVARHDCECHERLSQAHVITQRSMKPVLAEKREPIKAFLLIMPQFNTVSNLDRELVLLARLLSPKLRQKQPRFVALFQKSLGQVHKQSTRTIFL
mmetsp:Transcript_5665/g.11922  ORF Transcript_5665/g.11922 Transcript_5665/m.11922 type:complete len:218 (+) Transcript_5665:1209-1862(+)